MPMVCLKDDCFCSRESCDEYDICKERKLQEQTNEEWIQKASTEQLAELLYDIRYDYQIPWKNKGVVEWLKQPH